MNDMNDVMDVLVMNQVPRRRVRTDYLNKLGEQEFLKTFRFSKDGVGHIVDRVGAHLDYQTSRGQTPLQQVQNNHKLHKP